MPIKPIPDGYTAVTPYLTVRGAAAAIDFYKKAFGATEVYRLDAPDGKVMHAEIRIGDAAVMLHDEMPTWESMSPIAQGGGGASVMLFVPDVDATFKAAIGAGATSTMPVADQFYGDRCGALKDPFGHKWMVASRVENVSNDEIASRAAKLFAARSR